MSQFCFHWDANTNDKWCFLRKCYSKPPKKNYDTNEIVDNNQNIDFLEIALYNTKRNEGHNFILNPIDNFS